MTDQQIKELISSSGSIDLELFETHISWVILSGDFAYKIKKPVMYSFLDFSTLEKRKYYCKRELVLNRRLAPDMYIQLLGVVDGKNGYSFSEDLDDPHLVDYAVLMRRQENRLRMDRLLAEGKVIEKQIIALAKVLSRFHKDATKVREMPDLARMKSDFLDMRDELDEVEELLGSKASNFLGESLPRVAQALEPLQNRITERWEAGFWVDGHGDLHAGNIFLTDPQTVFDCIEFNDHFRREDVLNELAFLLMDLEKSGRKDLSGLFLKVYMKDFPCMPHPLDIKILQWYKIYRAGVKIKVNALKAIQQKGTSSFTELKLDTKRYIEIYEEYLIMYAS
jgi:hypothetical protein